ncbi:MULTISPECIES: helix-turn-helix domain-containing protein [Clostridium]|uniref:Helix-turn-helix transcriptional regulator n=1 Tax=Clostridium sporogenes TaxID=1509 RepID=A0A7X5PDC5_CLOSG|nr:helix-turn-helix transcriptional regulator [Clostridium sporogenes]AJD30666.1 helix-turn-helix family protein [Clostridium botulinum Prevot_594]MBY7016326.1 helix-turn-helix transcriptional regulator [Clostridium sporogenes]MCW6079004.1 helix-turn-helix transcriptional regulator [Clostridium sporogenes]NFQ18470.1 helix-turn-helix transcriptional regulator [Clostridium sporogenes]NFQ21977.1 helix-turn-helix transcriptional regulator [Clostridium sporogenes]
MAVLKTKEYRRMRNLSISKLSYKSKVARGYITELEEEKYKNPGIQVTCRLCKALKVTPNEIIEQELWRWW